MHATCSPATLVNRFLAPLPAMSPALATSLLVPDGGFSLVAERSGVLAALMTVAPASAGLADVGLLVADIWQRQGIGTGLLNAAIRDVRRAGFDQLRLTVRPDNRAVMPMLGAAGLRARLVTRDNQTQVTVRVQAAAQAQCGR